MNRYTVHPCQHATPIVSSMAVLGSLIVARCEHCNVRIVRRPEEFMWRHSAGGR